MVSLYQKRRQSNTIQKFRFCNPTTIFEEWSLQKKQFICQYNSLLIVPQVGENENSPVDGCDKEIMELYLNKVFAD
jgi:hypothetical protein